jgi:maltose-binding protein MalE
MDEMLYPANRFAASDSAYINNVKGGEIFYSQMNFAYSPTIVPMAHGVFWREFSMARERVMHGVQSTEEALNQAEKVIQAELDKAIGYEEYVNTQMEYPKVQ